MKGAANSVMVATALLFCGVNIPTPRAHAAGGVPLWTNFYNGPANSHDIAEAVAVDASGNVFVTGRSWSGNDPASSDYATVAYSSAGVPLWTRRYNGTANDEDDAYAIAVDKSGNVFVTGASAGTDFSFDYATLAYSGAGVPLWINRYSGPGLGDDEAFGIAVDSGGDVFVPGG